MGVGAALAVLTQPGSVSSRWAWVLQDALGIAFCLYMLKTVRLPTFKVLQLDSCVGSVVFLFKYILSVNSPVSVFAGVHPAAERPLHLRRFLRLHHSLPNKREWAAVCRAGVCSFGALTLTLTLVCLLQSGESIMVEVAAGPSDSATHEKVSLLTAFTSPPHIPLAGSTTFVCCLFCSSFLWC